jgi:uncharacterized protein (DUF1501 family)
MMGIFTRRDFLRTGCCTAAGAAAAATISRLGLMNVFAQSSTPYQALVCIFLFGGNDGNNTIIPYDSAGYLNYASLRSQLAIPQSQLLPIQPASQSLPFALHPTLTEVRNLFNSGQIGFVVNAGVLPQPTTQAQYLNNQVQIPINLFSHQDQQAQMQTDTLQYLGLPTVGWGGLVADQMQEIYGGTFPITISLDGVNVFAEGLVAQPLQTAGNPTQGLTGFSNSSADQARLAAFQSLLSFQDGPTLMQQAATTTATALQNASALAAALATGSKIKVKFTTSPLGTQLSQVAQILQVRGALGLSRQIFFVGVGGFDTHTAQIENQHRLLLDFDENIAAFWTALTDLTLTEQVVTFTLSDFARTLEPNSTAGSDHGWGNHHMVMGGPVVGGDFYGTWPTLALGGPSDATQQGRWIPTTSLDQYGATLAQWFGVPAAALPTIFPYLNNFAPNQTLAFLPAPQQPALKKGGAGNAGAGRTAPRS